MWQLYLRAPGAELTQDLFPKQESLCAAYPQQIAWSQAPVPLGVCHSNATRTKEVLGFMFEKRSQPCQVFTFGPDLGLFMLARGLATG
jgi:hypothetical protein